MLALINEGVELKTQYLRSPSFSAALEILANLNNRIILCIHDIQIHLTKLNESRKTEYVYLIQLFDVMWNDLRSYESVIIMISHHFNDFVATYKNYKSEVQIDEYLSIINLELGKFRKENDKLKNAINTMTITMSNHISNLPFKEISIENKNYIRRKFLYKKHFTTYKQLFEWCVAKFNIQFTKIWVMHEKINISFEHYLKNIKNMSMKVKK